MDPPKRKTSPRRGEKRELLKQKYIEEGKKRRENKLMRKMGVKKKIDNRERAVREKRRKLEDHFDMSGQTDIMDQKLLDAVSIEKMGWDIDSVISQEGRKGHLIEERSESEIKSLRAKIEDVVAARSLSKKLGTVKFESGYTQDLLAMTAPREITIEQMVQSTDPFHEIRKTFPQIDNLLLDVSKDDFSTMRAVYSHMEAYRLERQRDDSKKKPRVNLSKVFGFSASGDAQMSRCYRKPPIRTIPKMRRLEWYDLLEKLGCRSCHSKDEEKFHVMYLHVHEQVFLGLILRKDRRNQDMLTWVNYVFLQREDENISRKFENDDDYDDFEEEYELELGPREPQESDTFVNSSMTSTRVCLPRLCDEDDEM